MYSFVFNTFDVVEYESIV